MEIPSYRGGRIFDIFDVLVTDLPSAAAPLCRQGLAGSAGRPAMPQRPITQLVEGICGVRTHACPRRHSGRRLGL